LAKSINWVAAGLTKKLGVYTAIEFARRFGIGGRLEPVPSICLGTADVSLWEIVSAYAAFANKGDRFEPVTILRIEDKNGQTFEIFNTDNNYQRLFRLNHKFKSKTVRLTIHKTRQEKTSKIFAFDFC
jgi:penicillin-binding protein 1A